MANHLTLWPPGEKRNDARILIKWLMPRQTRDGGWPIGVTELALRELGFSAAPTLSDVDVMRTLRHLTDHTASTDLVSDFESAYARMREEAKKTPTPETVWTFYWPLLIKLADGITRPPAVTVLGTRFRFVPAATVMRALGARRLEPAALKTLLRTDQHVRMPSVFLVASKKAPDVDEAWRRLVPAFDTIRGLMEYGFGFGSFQLFFSEPMPRARVPHPQWMLMKTPGQPPVGTRFITEAHDDLALVTLGDTHLGQIRSLGRELRKEPRESSTLALIADALRLYAQAMDERFRYAAFMGLWQIAEKMTLSEASQGRTADVCTRLGRLVRNFRIPGSGLRHTLQAFAKQRNDIVHRGIRWDVDDEHVNLLKLVVEPGLLWLIRQHRKVPHQADLAVYYQLRDAAATEVTGYRDIARFVLALRTNEAAQPPREAQPRAGIVRRPNGTISA